MAPINVKIAIEREHMIRIVKFGKPDQAGIGQRGGHIAIALEQGVYCNHFFSER